MKKHLIRLMAAAAIATPLLASCGSNTQAAAETPVTIKPGEIWKDTDGDTINAHGGGVIFADGKYYWYGEHRAAVRPNPQEGVTVYSSPDLANWTYEGMALQVSDSVGSDIERGCIVERPKVIYNKKNNNYVMYFHLELKGQGYGPARYAVAVSDTPTGPFRFLKSGRSNAGILPLNLKKEEASTADPEKMVSGKEDAYIAMFDRWNPESLKDSRYLWLPVKFEENGTPYVEWAAEWSPSAEW